MNNRPKTEKKIRSEIKSINKILIKNLDELSIEDIARKSNVSLEDVERYSKMDIYITKAIPLPGFRHITENRMRLNTGYPEVDRKEIIDSFIRTYRKGG